MKLNGHLVQWTNSAYQTKILLSVFLISFRKVDAFLSLVFFPPSKINLTWQYFASSMSLAASWKVLFVLLKENRTLYQWIFPPKKTYLLSYLCKILSPVFRQPTAVLLVFSAQVQKIHLHLPFSTHPPLQKSASAKLVMIWSPLIAQPDCSELLKKSSAICCYSDML